MISHTDLSNLKKGILKTPLSDKEYKYYRGRPFNILIPIELVGKLYWEKNHPNLDADKDRDTWHNMQFTAWYHIHTIKTSPLKEIKNDMKSWYLFLEKENLILIGVRKEESLYIGLYSGKVGAELDFVKFDKSVNIKDIYIEDDKIKI